MTSPGFTVARNVPKGRTRPLVLLFTIFGLGLALGACSKCDVPNLLPNNPGPQTCHGGPPAQ